MTIFGLGSATTPGIFGCLGRYVGQGHGDDQMRAMTKAQIQRWMHMQGDPRNAMPTLSTLRGMQNYRRPDTTPLPVRLARLDEALAAFRSKFPADAR